VSGSFKLRPHISHPAGGAALRRIEGVGLELRFMWNGERAHSQVYKDVQDLLKASNGKHEELEARGWQASALQY
jgi:hypothetical protein